MKSSTISAIAVGFLILLFAGGLFLNQKQEPEIEKLAITKYTWRIVDAVVRERVYTNTLTTVEVVGNKVIFRTGGKIYKTHIHSDEEVIGFYVRYKQK